MECRNNDELNISNISDKIISINFNVLLSLLLLLLFSHPYLNHQYNQWIKINKLQYESNDKLKKKIHFPPSSYPRENPRNENESRMYKFPAVPPAIP